MSLFGALPRNIMHAAGCIEGHAYTNSLEALLHSLGCGEDLIELDCVRLADSYALAHDGTEERLYGLNRPFHSIALAEYQKARVCGSYRPMDFAMLHKLLALKPFRVVIDCKFEGTAFQSFLAFLCRELGPVLDKVVVQAYCVEDVHALVRARIKHCLVALWKYHDADPFGPSARDLVGQAVESGLNVIGTSLRYRNPSTNAINVDDVRVGELEKWRVPVFVHGQEAELTLMSAVSLNERFPLFSSRSYGELPLDFDVEAYMARHPDLQRFSPPAAAAHYIAFGRKEGRKYARDPSPVDVRRDSRGP